MCGDDCLRSAVSSIIKCCDHNRVSAEFLQACYVGFSGDWIKKITSNVVEITAGSHVGCCDNESFDEIICFLRPC